MPTRRSRARGPAQQPARSRASVPKRRDSVFQPEFREDLAHWIATNRNVALRAVTIVEAVLRDPFSGIGKPEPLKHLGPNTWSRRLTQVDRIVYEVSDDRIDSLQARYHY